MAVAVGGALANTDCTGALHRAVTSRLRAHPVTSPRTATTLVSALGGASLPPAVILYIAISKRPASWVDFALPVKNALLFH